MSKKQLIFFLLLYILFFFGCYSYLSNLINSNQIFTLFTPDIVFPCINNCEKLRYYLNIGKNKIKNSTVVFAGLIRNRESNLEFIISQIQRISEDFLDYSIIIVVIFLFNNIFYIYK